MSRSKISSNHPFTVKQLKTLLSQIEKLTALNKKQIGEKYIDIKIEKSAYVNEIFFSYTDITDPDYPKGEMFAIDSKGDLVKEVRSKMEFKNLADRVHFFNNMDDIKIDGINLNNLD